MKYTIDMSASKARKNAFKDAILQDGVMTDLEKLENVFAYDKQELKETNPQLYYAILAVLDSKKKPDATSYFNH